MSDDKPKCRCGKDAHPCYQERCEDCWVKDNQGNYSTRAERMVLVKVTKAGGKVPHRRRF